MTAREEPQRTTIRYQVLDDGQPQRTHPDLEADVVAACNRLGELGAAVELAHAANIPAIASTSEGLQRTLRELRAREVA